MDLGAAEVAVDEQDAPPVEREARREVGGDHRLAVLRAGAGDEDALRRVQRRRVLKPRADLAELLGHHRVRRLENDGRQRDAGRLRVVVGVREHAQERELTDARDVAR